MINRVLLASVFFILVFSYVDIYVLRVNVLVFLALVAVAFIGLLEKRFKIYKDAYFFISVVMLFFIFSLSIYGENYNVFYAFVIFLTISFIPYFVTSIYGVGVYNVFARVYIYSAIFMAFGVVVQSALYNIAGFIFGKVDLYGGGRIAFGFLWKDYSFLSLYLISVIPLILSNEVGVKKSWRWVFVLIVILGSFSTTARTGMVALIISFFVHFLLNMSFYIKRIGILLTVAVVLSSIVLFLFVNNLVFFDREISFSSSGRVDGYFLAFEYIYNNFFFGAFLDADAYRKQVSVIPHNIFIYVFSMGGFFWFFIFVFWLLSLLYKLYLIDDIALRYSFFICFVGLQFIPSVFSAYFLSVLILLLNLREICKYESSIDNYRARYGWS